MVPGLLQQPVACAGIRPCVALLAPVLGMLIVPAGLAVSLVGPVIGIRGHFFALPLRFSGPLTGRVRPETLGRGTGMRHKETPAMDTAHGAGHGFLLCEAVLLKQWLVQEEEAPQPKEIRQEKHVIAMRQEGKNTYVVTFWPVLLVYFLTGAFG